MIRAIITVYFPTEAVGSNVGGIAKQVDEVIICDNSPNKENRDLFKDCSNVKYLWFGENRGLSRAFNCVLKDASYDWKDDDLVLFFDQDSSVAEGHVSKMVNEFLNLKSLGYDIGCLGPVYYNTSNGTIERPKNKTYINKNTYSVASIITSSMLCMYGAMKRIDFWNENVFLDMADWDICWRLCAQGMLCCMTEVVTLHHSLGSGEKKFGPIRLRVGSAFREYYQLRESLYLLTKNYTPIKFKIRMLATIFVRSPLHLLLLDKRGVRLKYMSMGIRDYFKKNHGSLNL